MAILQSLSRKLRATLSDPNVARLSNARAFDVLQGAQEKVGQAPRQATGILGSLASRVRQQARDTAIQAAPISNAPVFGSRPAQVASQAGSVVSDFIKTAQEEIARSGASAGLTGAGFALQEFAPTLGAITGKKEEDIRGFGKELSTESFNISGPHWSDKVAQVIFGNRPLESVEFRIARGELNVQDFAQKIQRGEIDVPFTDNDKKLGEGIESASLPLSFVAIGGMIALDFTGLGGGKKQAAQALAKLNNVGDIIQLGKKMGIADDLVEEWAKVVAKTTDVKIIERSLDNIDAIQRSTKIAQEVVAPRQAPTDLYNKAVGARGVDDIASQASSVAASASRAAGRGVPASKTKGIINKTTGRAMSGEYNAFRQRIQDLARGSREGARATRAEIKEVQGALKDLIKKRLPPDQRRPFLERLPNIQKPEQIVKELEKIELADVANRIDDVLRTRKGSLRSRIAFQRKLLEGISDQAVVNDVKRKLNIQKPVSQMNEVDLRRMLQEMKNRVSYQRVRDFEPGLKGVDTVTRKIPGEVYQVVRDIKPVKNGVRKRFSDAGKTADKLLGPISTRLENINPSLFRRLRRFERTIRETKKADATIGGEFWKKATPGRTKLRRKGMSDVDFRELDFALKNGDRTKQLELVKKYGLEKEFASVRPMLDGLYKRAADVGFDVGYQADYYPRIVKDKEGFLEYIQRQGYWGSIEEAIQKRADELRRILTDSEKADIIDRFLRGYQLNAVTLSKTGNLKNRVIDFITPELNQFYARSDEALGIYIDKTNDLIEARRFFGQERKAAGLAEAKVGDKGVSLAKAEEFNNIEDSIGVYVTNLLAKGDITFQQERELTDILKARFNPGQMNSAISNARSLSYGLVLGGLENAITQIGDLGMAMYKGGVYRGTKATVKAIFRKSTLKKEDFVDEIIQEFSTKNGVQRVVDTQLTINGLRELDRIGKEILVNADLERLQKLSRNPNQQFTDEITRVFGDESAGVIADLQAGRITENVKYMLFNTLLDFQPVALSEMPEQYLKSGNGKIFYALKTWSIKILDVYRREVFKEIRRNPKRGMRNLVTLTTSLVVAEATADEIKDFVLGRDISLSDHVIDTLTGMVFLNRYTVTTAQRQGVGRAITEAIVPPAILADVLFSPVKFALDDDRDWRKDLPWSEFPVVGGILDKRILNSKDEDDAAKSILEKYGVDKKNDDDPAKAILEKYGIE